jgi:hypothetical protein
MKAEPEQMPSVAYTSAEIVRRGEEIYHRDVESRIANDWVGCFLVLDIESGDFEVDKQDLAASLRLLAKRPNAVLYGLRIGFNSAYRLGGVTRAPSSRSPESLTTEMKASYR